MNYILIIGLLLVTIFFILYFQIRRNEKKANEAAVLNLANNANHFAANIHSAKTVKSKINNAEKAFNSLLQASNYPDYKKIIKNYDETLLKLEAIIKVLPITGHWEKAEKNRFKKKDTAEKNNLLDIMYEIRSNNITDNDLDLAGLHDDNTGEMITISMIETRLKELGWEE